MAIQQGAHAGMRELALFAGAGGGILGGHLLGWRTVCAVERDAYAAQVLAQRQNDGAIPTFPIWSDVSSFDGKRWRGRVDAISGGFPCQDISEANRNAVGITGVRSGLWGQFVLIICEVGARIVYVENSRRLTSRGLDVVLGDLASLGFDAEWGLLSARAVGANHIRERIWILAHSKRHAWHQQPELQMLRRREKEAEQAWLGGSGKPDLGNILRAGLSLARKIEDGTDGSEKRGLPPAAGWWQSEPSMGRVADGVANRVDRLKAIGNGQVPRVAAAAFSALAAQFD